MYCVLNVGEADGTCSKYLMNQYKKDEPTSNVILIRG